MNSRDKPELNADGFLSHMTLMEDALAGRLAMRLDRIERRLKRIERRLRCDR